MAKDEVILVQPGPTGFFLRGIYYGDLVNSIANRIGKAFLKPSPKRVDTPLGILSVGTTLKNAGFKPRLIDGRYENIREKLKSYINNKTLFVGISSMTSYQIIFGLKTAKALRKIDPQIPIAWGGLHPTVLPEETLRTSSYVDIVCKGEGEITAVELAEALRENRSLEGIAGLAYKDEDGNIINNRNREFGDFAEMSPVDYSLLDPLVYDFSYISYQSSRGCPHRCKFCEVGPIHNRRYRKRSVQTIIKDIEDILKNFPVKEINMIDENFFVNLKEAREFANTVIEKRMNFKWRVMCRADYFRRTDAEFWRFMAKAGCDAIAVGGESGSQRSLDHMKKDYKVSDLINSASQLEKAGIDNSYSFICGLPEEKKEDMKQTVELVDYMLNNFKRFSLFEILVFMPLPMTPYYEELKNRCIFPSRLEDWGSFIWGNKRYHEWHPLHEYVFRLSLVSKWTSRLSALKILRSFKSFNIFLFLMYLCGYISHYRWRHKFFAFPVDIYMQYCLNKYIFKCLWQR